MRRFSSCGAMVFGFLLATWATVSALEPGDDGPVPEDLKISARYGAGLSDWKSWTVTIGQDGRTQQEVHYRAGRMKTFLSKLTERDLRELWGKIEAARFFDLEPRYTHPVTDCPTMILKVTANKKTYEVSVYAAQFVEDKAAVKRFQSVWSEVLRKVPSPNPDQKP